MNKKIIFKICLVTFLAFWQTASSYIFQIRHYCNPKTGKTIFMLSDQHNMGDKKQNLEQFEKFKKICVLLKKKGIMAQILFEEPYAYTLGNDVEKETMCEKIVDKNNCFKIKSLLLDVHANLSEILRSEITIGEYSYETDVTTWMVDLWPFALKDTNYFVIYKSIDPRLVAQIWMMNDKRLALLTQVSFLKNFRNLILYTEKIYNNLINDLLQSILKKITDEMGNERFLQLIAEYQEDKEKIQKLVKIEFVLGTFFSRALEHEALLHMCRYHDFKYTFLVAGGKHTTYLSQYMKDLGFELKESWGISSGEAAELGSNLPDDLKQKMDLAFDEIYTHIDKIEVSTQNTTSTTSSSNQYPVQQNNFNAYKNDDVELEDDNSEEQKKVEAISGPTKKRKIDEDRSVTIVKSDKK
jgi:hypothetical protein